MSTKKVGTPVEGDYDSYTAEQLTALENMKDRDYDIGYAHKKYLNHVVWPDGSITTDTSVLVKVAQAGLKKALGDDMEDPDALRSAEFAARRLKEVKDHIAMKQFVFFVDSDGNPTVYFQVAHPDRTDLPKKPSKEGAAAWHEEVSPRMQALIADSHRKAAARKAAANVGVIK